MNAGKNTPPNPSTFAPLTREPGDVWVVHGHAEVIACASDPERFSSRVSRHLQIPNGLDGDEHRRFRNLIEQFLNPQRVNGYQPLFEYVAETLVSGLPRSSPIEIISRLGSRLAVRAQCGWLGWAPELEQPLLDWMKDHREAARTNDLKRLAVGAARFDAMVQDEIERHRGPAPQGGTWTDAMSDLLAVRVEDPDSAEGRRLLTDKERISVLRNWVAGDLGSIADSVGVIAHQIASRPEIQREMRNRLSDRQALIRGIDELLRIDDPFLTNRRITTCPVKLSGQQIPAKAKVILHWADAGRDPRVFPNPDSFEPERNAPKNIVYGAGPHICPGRTLATIQLAAAVRALLSGCPWIRLADTPNSRRAQLPTGGFEEAWIVLEQDTPS
ncbi:MAG: cytochrome P450 [Kiritimatiellae bacterium]|nr:cytochrome P450 [Kiritimatiellia bacterium]